VARDGCIARGDHGIADRAVGDLRDQGIRGGHVHRLPAYLRMRRAYGSELAVHPGMRGVSHARAVEIVPAPGTETIDVVDQDRLDGVIPAAPREGGTRSGDVIAVGRRKQAAGTDLRLAVA